MIRVKFKKFLHSNEHPKRILCYIVRLFDVAGPAELGGPGGPLAPSEFPRLNKVGLSQSSQFNQGLMALASPSAGPEMDRQMFSLPTQYTQMFKNFTKLKEYFN